MNNDMSTQSLMSTVLHSVGGDFCDSSGVSTTNSCFIEISEIKFIESVKKVEIPLVIFIFFFVGCVVLIFQIIDRNFRILPRRRI